MRIACLAWGSLLWKPGELALASPWFAGGPALPLEFCRVGDGGELAVALCPSAAPVPTWWAWLAAADVLAAREQLRRREQIDPARPEWVGSLAYALDADGGRAGAHAAGHAPGAMAPPYHLPIAAWMHRHGVEAAVWTALPPRPADRTQEGRLPRVEEVIDYLCGLQGETRDHARDYIVRVPPALRTPYRLAIAQQLGWTPDDPA